MVSALCFDLRPGDSCLMTPRVCLAHALLPQLRLVFLKGHDVALARSPIANNTYEEINLQYDKTSCGTRPASWYHTNNNGIRWPPVRSKTIFGASRIRHKHPSHSGLSVVSEHGLSV